MPRLSEAKKDVTSCEKPERGANTLRPPDIRMGQPVGSDPDITHSVRRTRGTETSYYPQEKKVRTIPPVAASERGGAQTGGVYRHVPGLKGLSMSKGEKTGNRLERRATEGEGPVPGESSIPTET